MRSLRERGREAGEVGGAKCVVTQGGVCLTKKHATLDASMPLCGSRRDAEMSSAGVSTEAADAGESARIRCRHYTSPL